MDNISLKKFLAAEKLLQEKGFKFIWIFEMIYLNTLKEKYGKKMLKLKEKLENFEREGFSKRDFVFADLVHTSDSCSTKSKHFFAEFKKIISNKEMIPDNSCIVLNAEQKQHLLKSVRMSETGGMKKREKLSQVRLSNFFWDCLWVECWFYMI